MSIFHKTFLSLIFLTSFIVGGFIYFSQKEREGDAENVEGIQIQEVPNSAFNKHLKLLGYEPKELTFSEKTINIENVGLDNIGQLEVPTSWFNAGWYEKSAKTGEIGNMIIDGHYDTNYASPAAFWGLKYLLEGDRLLVKDRVNRIFTYEITDLFYVDIDDPARTEIFVDSEKAELTLITCGGIWDYSKGTYNKRLIVKAVLVK